MSLDRQKIAMPYGLGTFHTQIMHYPIASLTKAFQFFLKLIVLTLVVYGSNSYAQIEFERHSDKQNTSRVQKDNVIKKPKAVPNSTRKRSPADIRKLPTNVIPEKILSPEKGLEKALDPHIEKAEQNSTKERAKQKKSKPIAPDERVLWRLYNAHRYPALAKKIRAFKTQYPNWSPPPNLTRLIAERRKSEIIQRATANGEWQTIIDLSYRNPGYFNCNRIDASWNLAKAYSFKQQYRKATEKYAYIISRCPGTSVKLSTLQKASKELPDMWMHVLWSTAKGALAEPAAEKKLKRIHYEYDTNRFIEARDKGNGKEADRLAQVMEDRVIALKDVTNAEMLGWYFFNTKRYDGAVKWFERAHQWKPNDQQISFALALGLNKSHRNSEAAEIARAISNKSEKAKNLLGDILLQSAWQQFENRNFPESRRLAQEASELLHPNRNAEILLAWLDYRDENYQSAVASFKSLYQQQQSANVAAGLAQSYAKLDSGQLPELADRYNTGPLGEEIQQLYGQELYWRKHFLAANEKAPNRFPELQNIDSPWLSAGSLYRYKTGDNGLNRLDIFSYALVEGMYVHNRVHRMALHYDLINLNSQNPANCAPIGSLPIQAPCATPNVSVNVQPGSSPTIALNSGNSLINNPTTRLNAGHSFEFSYLRDGWYTPFFTLGVTPLNGVISPRPTLRFGFIKEFSLGRWGPEFYSQSVRESILSYTGIKDPYSNTRWGRVLRSGINLPLLLQLDDKWTVTGQLDAAALHGEQVKTNWTMTATVSGGYDFRPPGFDYFSFGPSFSFQHFDQNQNHFTIGHGGYFSPNHYINAGLALNFLTSEARAYVVRGRIGGGYQNFRTASAPWFPLGNPIQNAANVEVTLDGQTVYNDPPFYTGESRDGIAYDLELKGVWLVHPNIQLGGGVSARRSGGFDDYSAGLFFRYILDDRKASFSTDIPDYLFRKLY